MKFKKTPKHGVMIFILWWKPFVSFLGKSSLKELEILSFSLETILNQGKLHM